MSSVPPRRRQTREGRGRDGQVGGVERPQRRKLVVAELEDPLGGRQIFEPVLAEVPQREAREIVGRLRDEHLTAVTGCCDPRGR